MTTTTRNPRTRTAVGYRIAGSCPGCGADVDLDDDFLVTHCDHCGTTLRIVMPDGPPVYYVPCNASHSEARFHLDRYLRAAEQPLSPSGTRFSTRWVPYWRVDGFTLKVRNKVTVEARESAFVEDQETEPLEIRKRELTLQPFMVSMLATEKATGAPATLGMRVDQLPLRPLQSDCDDVLSRCLNLDCSQSGAVSRGHSAARSISNIAEAPFGRNETFLFHPSLTLIYFPIVEAEYGDRGGRKTVAILDGVTLHVHSTLEREDELTDAASAVWPVSGEITIEAHRCRNCGEDFPYTKAYAHICGNCGWHYIASCNTTPGRIQLVGKPQGHVLVPFWKFTGGSGNSVSTPMYVPAFGGQRFEQVYRISRRATNVIPTLGDETDATHGLKTYTASVGPETAAAIAEAVCYRAKHESTLGEYESLPVPDDFTPIRADLVYLPFNSSDYFYVDAISGYLSIERALLDSPKKVSR